MTEKAKRRGRGDAAIYWDASKGSYVGAISLGYTASGKRRRRKVFGRTKSEVRIKLRELRQEIETGVTSSARYTVGEAVQAWLSSGLQGKDAQTVAACRHIADTHIVPLIGSCKLRDLSAEDVDEWLAGRAELLATSTVQRALSVLRRSITHAQRRDLVLRNVAEFVTAPVGQAGRPSKALTLEQAVAVLRACRGAPLGAYFVLSLLTGIRTEEARALTWERVHLDQLGEMPPNIEVWRSVRATGDTKTRKSRRTLALPPQAVEALRSHRTEQARQRLKVGSAWEDNDLVFCTQIGTALDAANVRRSFRGIAKTAGLAGSWTPRELRHSFVSLLSAHGVSIEAIAHLVGHAGTSVTEAVYRKELRPVLTDGAAVIGGIFHLDTAVGETGSPVGSPDGQKGHPVGPDTPSDLH